MFCCGFFYLFFIFLLGPLELGVLSVPRLSTTVHIYSPSLFVFIALYCSYFNRLNFLITVIIQYFRVLKKLVNLKTSIIPSPTDQGLYLRSLLFTLYTQKARTEFLSSTKKMSQTSEPHPQPLILQQSMNHLPCQVLKTQVLCIQNSNLYCWQTMIKTMYLSCFRIAQNWFCVVKLD